MTIPSEAWATRLFEAGLSEREGAAKAVLFAKALRALDRRDDVRAWWVPGRIEFLGKHTDYAGGPSLLCAVERGFAVVAAARPDGRITVMDAGSGERLEAALDPSLTIRQNHWSNYPLTVCRRLARNFPGTNGGVDIAFAGDLPPAAGLSSSSALIVATFLALEEVNALRSRAEYRESIETEEDLAGYLGAIENGGDFRGLAGDRGVGTQGGSEDHTAILCARPGALVQYSFAPIRFERAIPLPNDHVFVVAVSGVAAEKTGGALALYNRAAERATSALDLWRDATGSRAATVAAALNERPDALEGFRQVLRGRPELLTRVEQFRAELELVHIAADALACGDFERLGGVVDQSQENAERWLGNQIPETTELPRSARALGAVAASAFGAGFGGSVYALVPATRCERFRMEWAAQYEQTFPDRCGSATFFVTAAGPSCTQLRLHVGGE